jgi:tetratricopeptide (TPR) repeat protein
MAEQLPRLRGREQWEAMEELERELDNIRVAWEWLVVQQEVGTAVQKMLPGLHRFAFVRMRQADVEPLVQAAMDKVRPVDGSEASIEYLALQTAVIDLSFQQIYHPPFFFPNGREILQELWPAAIARQQGMGEWFHRFLQCHAIIVGEDKAFREWESHNDTLRLQNDRWQLASSLQRFAAMLRFTDRDRTRPLVILQEALGLFKALGDEFETARTFFEFSWMSSWAEEYTAAIEYGQQAQELLAGKDAAVFRGRVIHEIFDAYLRMGRHDEAFACLAEEQEVYRQINRLDRLKISVSWESMEAGRYRSLDHAFEKRQESMALGRTIARTQGQAEGQLLDYDYFELGELYRISGDLKQARNCYDLAGVLFRSNNNEHGSSYYQRALGNLAIAEKKFKQAEPYFLSYLETSRDISFFWDVGMALINLSRALRGMGRYQESEERLREAVEQLDFPAIVASLVWPIVTLAELRAAQQRYHESALLAAFVLRQPLSWLEMRNLAEDVLREIKPHLELDFDVAAAAKTAEETLIPDLIQTRLPPLVLSFRRTK